MEYEETIKKENIIPTEKEKCLIKGHDYPMLYFKESAKVFCRRCKKTITIWKIKDRQ